MLESCIESAVKVQIRIKYQNELVIGECHFLVRHGQDNFSVQVQLMLQMPLHLTNRFHFRANVIDCNVIDYLCSASSNLESHRSLPKENSQYQTNRGKKMELRDRVTVDKIQDVAKSDGEFTRSGLLRENSHLLGRFSSQNSAYPTKIEIPSKTRVTVNRSQAD